MEIEKPADDSHLNISWDPEEIIHYAEKMGELRKSMTRQKGTLYKDIDIAYKGACR